MRITALALSGLVLVLFACSSEAPTGTVKGGNTTAGDGDDSNDPKGGNAGAPSSSSSSSSSSGGAQTTNPTDPAPAGGSCGAKADQKSCFDCCEASAPGAFETLDKAFGDCVCAADKCGTACAASACAATPKEPAQGDACDTCIGQQLQACDTKAVDACNADPNCKKLLACDEASKCQTKPE